LNNFTFLFIILFSFTSHFSIAQENVFKATDDDGDNSEGLRCGGTERWDVKTLTNSKASQVNYTPVITSINSLINIPTTPSTTAPRFTGIEFQSYTITCDITIKKNESDNDYHLVLSDGTHTMVGEVPDPTCSVAATSAHVNQFIAARNWVNTHIGTGAVSNVNIPPIDITGVAFVDAPHGQTGMAPNCIEIHPILNIIFASLVGIYDTTYYAPAFKVNVSPTTFSESTNFHITSNNAMFGNCRLEIYSVSGDKVNNLDIPVTNDNEINYTFHRNGLTNGLYIYRLLNNDETMYEGKIIIQ